MVYSMNAWEHKGGEVGRERVGRAVYISHGAKGAVIPQGLTASPLRFNANYADNLLAFHTYPNTSKPNTL